jgi:hypothetical protein
MGFYAPNSAPLELFIGVFVFEKKVLTLCRIAANFPYHNQGQVRPRPLKRLKVKVPRGSQAAPR